MIRNVQELEVTLERLRRFQRQVTLLRQTERNPHNYRLSAGGFLAEIDRMNLEVRDYLWLHPSDGAIAASEGYRGSRSSTGSPSPALEALILSARDMAEKERKRY